MGTAQEESLRNQLQVMKDRMKEMEELFSAQDEESRQLIQELKNEQKISSHKVGLYFIINSLLINISLDEGLGEDNTQSQF